MPIANLFLGLLTLLEPGYIGIQPAEITDAARSEYKIAADVRAGLVLTLVRENSPAARAGLRRGDVLTSFNEKPVPNIAALQALIAKHGAGQKVAYVARRGSGTIAGLLVLGKRPQEVREAMPRLEPGSEADLERRMAELQERIAKAHARATAEKARRTQRAAEAGMAGTAKRAKPTTWVGYMEREERALVRAEKSKNVERIIWHKARLSILREMGRPKKSAKARNANASKRARELEERMEMILERLEILEKKAEK
jgi:membrane-associated protease RseP (regulator of RpoE activity)